MCLVDLPFNRLRKRKRTNREDHLKKYEHNNTFKEETTKCQNSKHQQKNRPPSNIDRIICLMPAVVPRGGKSLVISKRTLPRTNFNCASPLSLSRKGNFLINWNSKARTKPIQQGQWSTSKTAWSKPFWNRLFEETTKTEGLTQRLDIFPCAQSQCTHGNRTTASARLQLSPVACQRSCLRCCLRFRPAPLCLDNFGAIHCWGAANGGLRDRGLSKSKDTWGKRPLSCVSWISQVLGKRAKKVGKGQTKAGKGRFPGRVARQSLNPHLLHPHLLQPSNVLSPRCCSELQCHDALPSEGPMPSLCFLLLVLFVCLFVWLFDCLFCLFCLFCLVCFVCFVLFALFCLFVCLLSLFSFFVFFVCLFVCLFVWRHNWGPLAEHRLFWNFFGRNSEAT